MTNQGERYGKNGHKRATISIMNVYDSDFEWPEGTKITDIRVLQLFPYPWHSPWQDQPRLGPGSGVSARAVLGVVPVEEDGSAYFEAPVEKTIYFQALDERGMAVQSMRSSTYVHPGEQLSCLGCHEKKQKAPSNRKVPMALKRPPSKLVPDLEDGSCPLTYARLVEPLLENKCNPCHEKNKKPKPDLKKYAFYYHGTGGHSGVQPIHGGYRTIAGRFGAIQSGLADKMLMKHHREVLTLAEINRITLWADANSNELGAYIDEDKQRAGEIVWPVIDMDPLNPAGIDLAEGRPAPPTPTAETPLMKQSEAIIKARWPDMKKTHEKLWKQIVKEREERRKKKEAQREKQKGKTKSPPVKKIGKGVDISDAVEDILPGWKVRNCGPAMRPGSRANWAGRQNVLMTHPLDKENGCVLSRELDVAAGKKTVLRLDVSDHPDGDWILAVRVNNKEISSRTIDSEEGKSSWTTVETDLSEYAGKKVLVELVNEPNGWSFEAGYWHSIKVEEE